MKTKNSTTRRILAVCLPLLVLAGVCLSQSDFLKAQDKANSKSGSEVVPFSEVKWTPLNAARGDSSPQAGTLWGKPGSGETLGTLLKLPAGFSGEILSDGAPVKAVVVEGGPQVQIAGEAKAKAFSPGSYFSSDSNSAHSISSKEESMLYIRTAGKFGVTSGASKK